MFFWQQKFGQFLQCEHISMSCLGQKWPSSKRIARYNDDDLTMLMVPQETATWQQWSIRQFIACTCMHTAIEAKQMSSDAVRVLPFWPEYSSNLLKRHKMLPSLVFQLSDSRKYESSRGHSQVGFVTGRAGNFLRTIEEEFLGDIRVWWMVEWRYMMANGCASLLISCCRSVPDNYSILLLYNSHEDLYIMATIKMC